MTEQLQLQPPPAETCGVDHARGPSASVIVVKFDLGRNNRPRLVMMDVNTDTAILTFREPGKHVAFTLPVMAAFVDAVRLGDNGRRKSSS